MSARDDILDRMRAALTDLVEAESLDGVAQAALSVFEAEADDTMREYMIDIGWW